MMEIELTTIGERGQLVIPQAIREKMPAPKGTMFSVVLINRDVLVMKKVDKRKLLGEFKELRASIKEKLAEAEVIEEVKISRRH